MEPIRSLPDYREIWPMVYHPLLCSVAIQSASVGFVGTDRSTFSILFLRRVQSWHDGATRMVLWGRPGADDHSTEK
ncbi:hypothetical protein B0H11DRAFT_2035686 [Mycena galericulata]|nr:hypothetical protein B0H11DRAFT_2035686 [Mycena galericulata]